MFVYICACIYVNIYMYIYIYMYIQFFMNMYIQIYINIYMYIYMYIKFVSDPQYTSHIIRVVSCGVRLVQLLLGWPGY